MDISPLQRLEHPAARVAGVRLWVKRDDLLTPAPGTALQGNKVRKLGPVLAAARSAPQPPLLVTFGGAYSNHLAALAEATRRYGLRSVAFVRGREVDNPVLRHVVACGTAVRRLTRAAYRLRHDPAWLAARRADLAGEHRLDTEQVWIIPEGGTTAAGVAGCGAVYAEILAQLGHPPARLCVSAGTGGTAAGIIGAAQPATTVEVFPALKGNWMAAEIEKWLPPTPAAEWVVVGGYAFGGYGRCPADWHRPSPGLAARADPGEPGLPPLEPVYTAKLFAGVLDRLRTGCYPAGSDVVIVHTGGIY